jgi:cytochrome c peroxidase
MRSLRLVTYFFSSLLLFWGCTNDKKNPEERDVQQMRERNEKRATLALLNKNSALPMEVIAPANNPNTPEKIALGKLLFFDPILSGNKDVACATCHHPETGYAELLDISIGVNGQGLSSRRAFKSPNDIPFVKRNAHTVINTAFNGIDIDNQYDPEEAPMFWDDRVKSLEGQALEPILALEEMRGRRYEKDEILDEVVSRLGNVSKYQQLFEAAFPEDPVISSINIGKAIAAFERTLTTNNSRFDQYMRGDESAISISEKEGFETFKKVGCVNCHNGPMFSDYKMHVLGIPENEKLVSPDSGFEGRYAFRTASLRNLRFTAPYMHNGSMADLMKVLEFYEDISFGKNRNPLVTKDQFDPLVKELNLSVKEMRPIISFLNTLNDTDFDKEIPESVPSGLPVGGNIH